MVALMMAYEVMVTDDNDDDGTFVGVVVAAVTVDCISSLTGDAFIRGMTRLTVMNMKGNSCNQLGVNGGGRSDF